MTVEIEAMIDKAYEFVMTHRCEKAFHKWTEKEIRDTFLNAILHRSLLICSDMEGNVIGIVHGIADERRHIFHVSNILTIHPEALKSFIRAFDNLWPAFKLAGNRYGKLKQYDTVKFKRRILKCSAR